MADSALKEAIRIVLETEGREGVDALRKSLESIGDVSVATASDTGKLLDKLTELNERAAKANRFADMAKDLESTTTALDEASRAALALSLQIASTDKPSKEMQATYKQVRAEVDRLEASQKKQAEATARAGAELQASGFDTAQLASANQRLRTQIEGATTALQKQVGVVEKEAAATAKHKALIADQDEQFRKLAKSGQVSAQALADYRARADAAADGTRRLTGEGGRLGSMFSGLRGIVAPVLGFLTFRSAIDGVKNLLGVGAAAESAQRSLGNLYGSQEAGNRAFAALKQLSKDNGLAFATVMEDAKKLKAFGLDPLNGSYQALVDQNASVGGSQEDLSGKVLALGQAWAKQKLQGEEILQLTERGVPVWDLLQKATGKNVAELQKLSVQGKLGRDVIAALYTEIGKANAGAANKELSSLTGLLSQASAKWQEFVQKVADNGVTEYFKQQIQGLLGTTGNLDAIAQRVAATIIQWFEAIKTTAQQLAPLAQIVGSLTATLASHANAIANVIKAWALFRLAEIAIGFSKLTLGVQATTTALVAQRAALAATGTACAASGIGSLTALFTTLGARIAAVATGLARFLKIGGIPAAVLTGTVALVEAYTKIAETQNAVEAASARSRQYQRDQIQLGQQLQQLYAKYANTVIQSGQQIEGQTLDQSKAYAFSLESAKKYFQGIIKEATASGRAIPPQITGALRQIDTALAEVSSHIDDLNAKAAKQSGVQVFVDNAVNKFDELVTSGKAAAEAVKDVFDGIDFTSPDGIKQAVSIVDQVSIRSADAAKAITGELGAAIGKLSVEKFPELEAAADQAFGAGTEKAKAFAATLEGIRLNKLGVDLDAIKTGMTAAGREVVTAFQQFVGQIDTMGLTAAQKSQAIAQAFDNAFKQASTSSELQALKTALQQALSVGDIGFNEFKARVAEVDGKLAELASTGKTIGDAVAQGAGDASDALADMGKAADRAGRDVDRAGDSARDAGDKAKEGAQGVREQTFAFAQMSQSAYDALFGLNKLVVAQDLWRNNVNRIVGEFEQQRDALAGVNKELDDQLAALDPLTAKVKALQQQYGFVDEASLRALAQKQQQLDDARKRAAEETARAAEDRAKADGALAEVQDATRAAGPTTSTGTAATPSRPSSTTQRSGDVLATLRVQVVGGDTVDLQVSPDSGTDLIAALQRAKSVSVRGGRG